MCLPLRPHLRLLRPYLALPVGRPIGLLLVELVRVLVLIARLLLLLLRPVLHWR